MDSPEIKEYLTKIDEVIARGPYKDNWESLCRKSIPQWYEDAKFGIFIGWGVYSVPAFDNEWYPHSMYNEGSPAYKHHIETYGPHKEFGYTDFIPLFKAENFDPAAWVKLFKKSGAQYVMPIAEHHDGFQMYDSALSEWNAKNMGPKRDVLGELKQEIEKQGMVFATSSHRAENFWFFGGCRHFDSGLQDMEFQEPYGYADPVYSDGMIKIIDETNDIYSTPASREHLEDWLARSCEIVDRYRPRILWFDFWIQNFSFKPYLKKFAAYYYNRAQEWGYEVAINYKFDAFMSGSAVFDVERGQLKGMRRELWQTDTAIAKNSWSYTLNNEYKKSTDIVADLMDIVSKNGCLLLNVGPKSDGTIGEEETAVLEDIGRWLKANGEAVYGTRPWAVYGEGLTDIEEGDQTDTLRESFTEEDVRFTYKAPYLYATVQKWPKALRSRLCIKSLKKRSLIFRGHIESVEFLSRSEKLTWHRTDKGLELETMDVIDTDFPVCLKILLD